MPPLTGSWCWATKICSSEMPPGSSRSFSFTPWLLNRKSYVSPSVSHQGNKMKTLRKSWKSETSLRRLKPVTTHTRRWWYHIPSEVFWRRAQNSRVRSNSLAHPVDELLLVHAIKKEVDDLRLNLARVRSCNPETRSPDSVEARILPVILDDDTLLRRLMRRNSPFTTTNVTHLPDSIEESQIIIFSSSSLSFSFIWWKEKRTTCRHSKKRRNLGSKHGFFEGDREDDFLLQIFPYL